MTNFTGELNINMDNYISANDMAEKWNVCIRDVQYMCKKGVLPGAKKHSGVWLIPSDAERPIDRRIAVRFTGPIFDTTPINYVLSDSRAITMLTKEGYETLGDIINLTRDDIDKIPKIGVITRERIIQDLETAKKELSGTDKEKEEKLVISLATSTLEALKQKASEKGIEVEEYCKELLENSIK